MVTGIVIPYETRLSLQKVEFQNLTDYQTATVSSGHFETVKMDGHPLVIVAEFGCNRSTISDQLRHNGGKMRRTSLTKEQTDKAARP